MSQGFAPFYDVNRTYEDNYLQGPFGAFAEVMKGASAAGDSDTKSPPSVKSDARSGVGAEVAVIAAAIAMATDLLSVFKSFFIHFPP